MKLFKIIFGIVLLFAIIAFYVWTKLIVVSIMLLLVINFFLFGFFSKLLVPILSKRLKSILKYCFFILVPIVFAIFIRTFFFDIYFVPSSSMERTLFPNDYVLINKIKYGVKIPKHLRNTPVIGRLYSFESDSQENDLYSSLKGFENFKREDIVVFKAVDNTDKYLIKRIIGLPGEALIIKDTKVYINTVKLNEQKNYSFNYISKNGNRFSTIANYSNQEFKELSEKEKSIIERHNKTASEKSLSVFPEFKQSIWTRDNYGELLIPKKGMKIILNEENIGIYRELILKFENPNLDFNKSYSENFTFKNDYYFMMGDNRHNSTDSRFFGFVPESYIQGKMIFVFSKKRLFN